MTQVKKYSENGRLNEIIENGETVWTEDDSIRRDKISERSRNELHEHIVNGEYKEYAKKTFEILTGQTVKEFETNQDQTNEGGN